MRKYSLALLAAAAIGLAAGAASAADLPRKAYTPPPAPLPVFSWTGFYLGINGGAGWGNVDSTFGITPDIFLLGNVPLSSHSVSGWLFGGQIGYNWQVQPWLVLGIEGDGEWTDDKGTAPCLTGFNFVGVAASCSSKNKSLFDVTGRVGFAVDRAMLYVKGGWAWSEADHTINATFLGAGTAFTGTINKSRSGGLFGAGVEYAFLPNWSAKLEYNYMDFGTITRNFDASGLVGAPPGSLTANAGVKSTVSVVKAGVNYRFWGWGGM